MKAQPRKGTRRRYLVLGAAVVGIVGVVVWLVLRPSAAERELDAARLQAAPLATQFPAATATTETVAYLARDGRSLVTVLHSEAIAQLASDEPTADACQERADLLEQMLPAETSVEIIEAVPDDVLRELLFGERQALGSALTRCITGQAAGADVETVTLADSVGLTDTRLETLGVVR